MRSSTFQSLFDCSAICLRETHYFLEVYLCFNLRYSYILGFRTKAAVHLSHRTIKKRDKECHKRHQQHKGLGTSLEDGTLMRNFRL